MIKLTYYGHACFLLDDGTTKVLLDPFFSENPMTEVSWESIDCQYILVTHGHADHLGDAALIAKKTGAVIVTTPEVGRLCPEAEVHGMNLGGSHVFPFAKVRMTLALHSAGVAGGQACGFVLHYDDINIYFAGDTALFGDMQLIGRKERIDYAILPIGDNYTMGIEDAALAAQWLNARNVIPMHYNTWPVIAQDVESYKDLTEKMSRAQVHIVSPGGELELK
jgi:L-ascorbate metabolism protein UlaG (beta-lactamase superfamily)